MNEKSNAFDINILKYKYCLIINYKLTPLTPFFSLSSINNDKYSGDLGLRFKKNSKSAAIICLKILSLLKEL